MRINDPRGPLADSAAMAAGTMAFKRHRYEDADYYYNIVRTDYPKSKFQLQSHLLGVQCKLLKYQGPGYNSKPLEEANQLIDQTLAQFTNELGDERERLVKAKAEVRAEQATRDIQLAQYWDKGDHYGAARIYYAQVLKDYPQTPFADEAKTRLAALEGKPTEPPAVWRFRPIGRSRRILIRTNRGRRLGRAQKPIKRRPWHSKHHRREMRVAIIKINKLRRPDKVHCGRLPRRPLCSQINWSAPCVQLSRKTAGLLF